MTDLHLPWSTFALAVRNRHGDTVCVVERGADWAEKRAIAEAIVAAMNERAILQWVGSGKAGASSKWLVQSLTGVAFGRGCSAPLDNGDSEICAQACDEFGLWPRLGEMLGHGWTSASVLRVRARRPHAGREFLASAESISDASKARLAATITAAPRERCGTTKPHGETDLCAECERTVRMIAIREALAEGRRDQDAIRRMVPRRDYVSELRNAATPAPVYTIVTVPDGREVTRGASAAEAWERAAGHDGAVRMRVTR